MRMAWISCGVDVEGALVWLLAVDQRLGHESSDEDHVSPSLPDRVEEKGERVFGEVAPVPGARLLRTHLRTPC
jgi:hypothetical protein